MMKPNTKAAAIVSLALLAGSATAATLVDDFNDGDDAGWTRYDPIGTALGVSFASFSFPGGNSYGLQAPSSPNSALGPSRVGAYRAGLSQTNFTNTIDIIDWEAGTAQSFGLVARGGTYGIGTTSGYAFTMCDLCDFIAIIRIDNEQLVGPDSDPSSTGTSFASLALDSANDYRLVFTGSGSSFTGEIYDLNDLSNPLGTVTATDSTYALGNPGLLAFADSTDGTNVTFDNFSAVPEPASALLLGMGALLLARRQRRNA